MTPSHESVCWLVGWSVLPLPTCVWMKSLRRHTNVELHYHVPHTYDNHLCSYKFVHLCQRLWYRRCTQQWKRIVVQSNRRAGRCSQEVDIGTNSRSWDDFWHGRRAGEQRMQTRLRNLQTAFSKSNCMGYPKLVSLILVENLLFSSQL